MPVSRWRARICTGRTGGTCCSCAAREPASGCGVGLMASPSSGASSDAMQRPAAEIDPLVVAQRVSERAVRGGLALGLRQLLVQALNLAGMIALARILAPAGFGWGALAA